MLRYSAAFRAQSPGRLLIHATLERAFAVGLRRHEFLGDFDAYKLRWATEAYDRVLFQAFAPSPAGTGTLGRLRLRTAAGQACRG